MPMPSVPFAYLVLCQAELVLGRLEARLNLPARARHPHHLLQRGGLLGGENHVVSELVRILYAPPHQQPMAPKHLLFAQLQAVQRQECPVVEAPTGASCAERAKLFTAIRITPWWSGLGVLAHRRGHSFVRHQYYIILVYVLRHFCAIISQKV